MSFIAKNPLIIPEVESSPSVPKTGTRGLFAGKDGWYDIDGEGNVSKIIDESRVTKEGPDITETWGINIGGAAAHANYANMAYNDNAGNAFTSFYVSDIWRADETHINVGTRDNPTKYQISATSQKYVDDKISEVTQKIKESYTYNVVNMADCFRLIPTKLNTVTYAYGGLTQSGTIAFEFSPLVSIAKDESYEAVVILDLSSLTTTPTIQFEAGIKWLNGEPPTIEAGKIYMFSFILTKDENNSDLFYLGIGGEFA